MSIVTYGMLWKWLTSDSADTEWLLGRYKCFLLDEFAKLPAQHGSAQEVQPKMEEIASVLAKVVQLAGADDYRLVVTSGALRQAHVEQIFGESAGFLSITARRFGYQRFVAAPMDISHALQVCA